MADTGGMKTLVTLILTAVLAATPAGAVAQPEPPAADQSTDVTLVAPAPSDDIPTLGRSSWG
jgi:hypothetical protein